MHLDKRLGDNIEEWRKIGTSETVLKSLSVGVPINFSSRPNKYFKRNPKFVKAHSDCIKNKLKELLEKDAIEVVTRKLKVISPLNVDPKKNKKYRLITNLKV